MIITTFKARLTLRLYFFKCKDSDFLRYIECLLKKFFLIMFF